MKRTLSLTAGAFACAALFLASPVTQAANFDAAAAQAFAKDNECFKCHTLDKTKKGPSYKKISAKYKGKADAEDKLTKHITTSPTIEIDGKKEEHKSIKSKDAAEIKNVVQWTLAL